MVVFPNAKINLGLYITEKRTDGYHNLETVFYPSPITDILEFIPSEEFSFQSSGLTIDANPASNLCVKAYDILKNRFPELPTVQMHLHKIIPMGAGLGGGSADGSFVLTQLNNYFQLGLSQTELLSFALQLGSDCPFFILNTPCFAEGRGEILSPISLNLSGYWLTIIHPGIHISTAKAFAGIVPAPAPIDLKEKILSPIETWKDWLRNDFETNIFKLYPEIADIKDSLYQSGAVYASMSGSGSAVYGIFREKTDLMFPEQYVVLNYEL
jgi:4-diphosphocytidyl-2-C-methyl-D-erythritol kinase